jgi:hypothetical protein
MYASKMLHKLLDDNEKLNMYRSSNIPPRYEGLKFRPNAEIVSNKIDKFIAAIFKIVIVSNNNRNVEYFVKFS